MNASGSTASRDIRVLSPRIEPPDRAEEGSTARTATFDPAPVRVTPSWSMTVDLPTPGTPLMPARRAEPLCGSSATSSSCACSRWSPRRDSTRVMARDRKSTRLNSSHANISYAVFCLKKKKQTHRHAHPATLSYATLSSEPRYGEHILDRPVS